MLNLNRNFYWLILLIILGAGINITAQQKSDPKAVPSEIIDFFAGQWSGAGKFANGKAIEADVSFTAELDNQKLLYRHTDRAPNRYKALGTWGFERDTGKFVMIVEDNFGGSRRFESDGWINGKIIFLKDAAASNFPERFTFERLSGNSFKMTYEAKRNGQDWKMGDYLIFNRITR